MKKRALVLTIENPLLHGGEKRAGQLMSFFRDFDFASVAIRRDYSCDGWNYKGSEPARNQYVKGLHRLPDLPHDRAYSLVYFDSFITAFIYAPLVRRINARAIIIVDSFPVEWLRERMLNQQVLPFGLAVRPLRKLLEMMYFVYRQSNYVFVRCAEEEQKVHREMPLLQNIRLLDRSGAIPVATLKEIAASMNVAPAGRASGRKKLVSIVVVVYNQMEVTRICLDSVFRNTKNVNYELIIIDNNSSDATPAYLRKIKMRKRNIRIVTNSVNLGYTRAVNQGVHCARGEYIVLLNNDTVVHAGWLKKMIDCLESDTRIGAVGPDLDYSLNGDGKMCQPRYAGLGEFTRFAEGFERIYDHVWIDVPYLSFRCILFPRGVLRDIGQFDESVNRNTLQDIDYCFRMKKAGLRLVSRLDVYIHHYGSATFQHIPDFHETDGEGGLRRMIIKNGSKMLEYYSHLIDDVGPGFISLGDSEERAGGAH